MGGQREKLDSTTMQYKNVQTGAIGGKNWPPLYQSAIQLLNGSMEKVVARCFEIASQNAERPTKCRLEEAPKTS